MKRLICSTIACFILTSLLFSNVQAEEENSIETTLMITPVSDTAIHQNNPDKNFATSQKLSIRNEYGGYDAPNGDGWSRQILIKFDLDGIESEAVIQSAKLKMYYYDKWDTNPAGRVIDLTKVSEDWDEYSVTWNSRPICSDVVISSSFVPESVGNYVDFDITSEIQSILAGDSQNFGWRLIDDQYFGSIDIPISIFASKENSIHNSEPTLEINYLISDENINEAPVSDFSFQLYENTLKLTDLSYDSDGEIASWLWDFGDGDTSTMQSPTHNYKDDGTYVVKLFVTDDYGKTDYYSVQIEVSSKTDNAVIIGSSDDAKLRNRNPDTNYGDKELVVVRNDVGGGESTGWESNLAIKFDLSKVPDIEAKQARLCLYYEKYKDNDPEGRTLSLNKFIDDWDEESITDNNNPDFEDEISGSAIIPSSSKQYIKFDVTDDILSAINNGEDHFGYVVRDLEDFGHLNIPMTYIRTKEYGSLTPYLIISSEILNDKPSASFTYEHDDADILFYDESSDPDGDDLSYLWDFGDGTTSEEQNPVHRYTSTYIGRQVVVKLTVTDENEAQDVFYGTLIPISGEIVIPPRDPFIDPIEDPKPPTLIPEPVNPISQVRDIEDIDQRIVVVFDTVPDYQILVRAIPYDILLYQVLIS